MAGAIKSGSLNLEQSHKRRPAGKPEKGASMRSTALPARLALPTPNSEEPEKGANAPFTFTIFESFTLSLHLRALTIISGDGHPYVGVPNRDPAGATIKHIQASCV